MRGISPHRYTGHLLAAAQCLVATRLILAGIVDDEQDMDLDDTDQFLGALFKGAPAGSNGWERAAGGGAGMRDEGPRRHHDTPTERQPASW